MKQFAVFVVLGLLFCFTADAQNNSYRKEIRNYQKRYVTEHEVVGKKDKKYFRFFKVDESYNVSCHFTRISDMVGFSLNTSAGTQKQYFKYGRLDFEIRGDSCRLYVYQSKDLMQTEEYRNYLFVPFTDATTGISSYGSGRYLEFFISDIQNNMLQLDFNKAYNPYCAYATGYKCPIPPKENFLTIAIKAGEKNFAKTTH